jgi:long-subunit acyl-CoA synthetase (AMP-forming)
MMGYLGQPAETAMVTEDSGWLHTGDIVSMDSDREAGRKGLCGFVTVCGRMAGMIVRGPFDFVFPERIERAVEGAVLGLSACVVVGGGREYLTLLLTLKTARDALGKPLDDLSPDGLRLSNSIGSTAATVKEVLVDQLVSWQHDHAAARSRRERYRDTWSHLLCFRQPAQWHDFLNETLAKLNRQAKSAHEIVRFWTILRTEFSDTRGELTWNGKLRRAFVEARFIKVVDLMYPDQEQDA